MTIFGRVGVTSNYPYTIPGTVFYADAATLSASPVASWSYGAGNLVQATGASQPLWAASSSTMNGQPSVIYDGTKQLAAPNTAALQLVGDMTMATVFRCTSLSAFGTLVSKGATSEFDFYVQTTLFRCVRQGNFLQASPALVVINTPIILICTCISNRVFLYVNSNFVTSGLVPLASTTANAVVLGQRSDLATNFIGEQPEVMLFNRALAPIEVAGLSQFWSAKYNIPRLP